MKPKRPTFIDLTELLTDTEGYHSHQIGDKLEVLKSKVRFIVEESDGLLSLAERNVIIHCVYLSESVAEYAKKRHCSKQYINTTLKTAIDKLKEYFKDDEINNP